MRGEDVTRPHEPDTRPCRAGSTPGVIAPVFSGRLRGK